MYYGTIYDCLFCLSNVINMYYSKLQVYAIPLRHSLVLIKSVVHKYYDLYAAMTCAYVHVLVYFVVVESQDILQ